MPKRRRLPRRIRSVRSNNRPPVYPGARKLDSKLVPDVNDRFRMMITGLNILQSEGVVMPDSKPVMAIHPVEDEVMVIVPGFEGEHPFVRVITEGWQDCFFVVGYTPRYVSNICEPGALMVVRRFKERPSDHFLGEMLSTEWEGLVRP